MEGAEIYQIAKNCRTSVEMIEKYYAAHIKTSLTPPRSTSCGQNQKRRKIAENSKSTRPSDPGN
jgi:hypothetical protein